MTSSTTTPATSSPAAADPSAPEVSVVIPAYNAEDTILSAVQSVLDQTCTSLEVLVIDDGSIDATVARLATLTDARLRVFRYANGGVAAARNRGMKLARGAFISFLDADDLWTRDKLETQLRALHDHPGAGAAYSWTAFVDERATFLFAKAPQHVEGDLYGDLLVNFSLASGSNVLARRGCLEALGGFDREAQPVEDWEYWLRVARQWPFVVVRAYQVLYRLRAGSASPTGVERYLERIRAVVARELEDAPPELKRRAGECLANAHQHAAGIYLWRTIGGDGHRKAAACLARSIRAHPRVLIRGRTWAHAVLVLIAHLVTPGRGPSAVRALLRLYGRWTLVRHAGLRRRFGPRGSARPR